MGSESDVVDSINQLPDMQIFGCDTSVFHKIVHHCKFYRNLTWFWNRNFKCQLTFLFCLVVVSVDRVRNRTELNSSFFTIDGQAELQKKMPVQF